MSDESKGSGAPADASGAQTGAESKEKKTVSFDDHDRALKDLHKYKAQAKEAADKAAALEQEKLLAEGKKDEVIKSLQGTVAELKNKTAEMQKNFAWDKVKNVLKTKAASAGIIDSGAADKFVSLVDFKGRNPFRDDSTFDADENVLNQVFEDAKKDMPYFFSKAGPTIKDTTPPNGTMTVDHGNDFSKMTLDQIRESARKQSARQ